MREKVAAGRTVFFSTHLLDQAERLCSRMAIIHRGRLAAAGSLGELRANLPPDSTLEEVFFAHTGDSETPLPARSLSPWSSGSPVSFPKVTALIAGLFLRRFGNRMTAGLRRKSAPGLRAGTGRKSVGSPLGLIAIVVIFIFNTVNISAEAIKTLASELGPTRDAAGRVEIGASIYDQLGDSTRLPGPATRPRIRSQQIFPAESEAGNVSSRADYAHNLAQWYDQKGLAGFVPVISRASVWFPRLRAWHDPGLRPLLLHALGLILLILAGARHCWTLGSRNQDLGQVEWSTEWLFTLPASSRDALRRANSRPRLRRSLRLDRHDPACCS